MCYPVTGSKVLNDIVYIHHMIKMWYLWYKIIGVTPSHMIIVLFVYLSLQIFGDVIHELISVLYYLRVFMCQMIMSICTGVHRLCSTFSYSNIRKCIVIQC